MSFAATVLQNLRHTRREQGHRVDGYELRSRAGNVGFTRLFQQDTPLLLGSESLRNGVVQMIKNMSDERTHEIVVMDKGTVNKKVSRSCVITPQQNSSQLLTVNFTTLVYDFDMLPQQLYNGGRGNNEIQYAEDFEQKLVNIEDDALASVEASCIAAFLGYKTVDTAYNAQTPYTIDVVNQCMSVPLAEHIDFLNQIDGIVSLHKFGNGALNIVGSTMYQSDIRRYAENDSLKVISGEGVSNSVEGWQLANKSFRFSDYLPAIAGVKNRVAVAKPSSFALVTQNPPAFQEGVTTSDGVRFEETGALPISGFSMGHQFKTECLNGKETQEFHQFSINYATITAHNSDPANEASAAFEACLLDT